MEEHADARIGNVDVNANECGVAMVLISFCFVDSNELEDGERLNKMPRNDMKRVINDKNVNKI